MSTTRCSPRPACTTTPEVRHRKRIPSRFPSTATRTRDASERATRTRHRPAGRAFRHVEALSASMKHTEVFRVCGARRSSLVANATRRDAETDLPLSALPPDFRLQTTLTSARRAVATTACPACPSPTPATRTSSRRCPRRKRFGARARRFAARQDGVCPRPRIARRVLRTSSMGAEVFYSSIRTTL